ncbi:MAG: multicopper oxidase domain-containing protein [Acidobacteria bacterium]|nr:multicopper oxidase domain-containing protein [Acidobacteriota bacterium]
MTRSLVLLLLAVACWPASPAAAPSPSVIQPNDNRTPAGVLRQGTLTLALRAATGQWQPEGPAGPTLEVDAFGADGDALMVPAPLIRVVEGTEIVASVRNDLNQPLVINGLCARDGSPCAPLQVPPRETREVHFPSGRAGTYHYWASTIGAPVPFRELAGAFIVDPAGVAAPPDRVLVITEWSNLTPRQLSEILTADNPTEVFVGFNPQIAFFINGLSWPATERLTYDVGDHVRWRVINLSSQIHPMHLHGFYFDVNSLGNGVADTAFDATQARHVVTQVLPPAGTMTMTWVPERAGNWLLHCHVMTHVSPERRLPSGASADAGDARGATHADAHHGHHAADPGMGMAAMVMGITVRDTAPVLPSKTAPAQPARQLTLLIEPIAPRDGATRVGLTLREGDARESSPATSPGPAIVLRRDQPVEITVENRMSDATAIHWHGMELESYYDGVHGWSGADRRVTPMIEPGGRFVARFTPPRAGTFIYHTHLHDYRQLTSGLYGPLVVVDDEQAFDPKADHVIMLGRRGVTTQGQAILGDATSAVINGERAPRLVLKAGTRHRVRLINITPDDILSVSLQSARGVAEWTPIAKDGAPLPPAARTPAPARQIIAVGETYDFEFDAPPERGTAWLEVRTPGGKWQAQGHVVIR